MKEDRIVERFLEYVQIDSETKNEGEFAKRLKLDLEALGFEVYEDDAGKKVGSNTGNLIATLKGNKDAETIMFSCHMDTVSPGNGIKPVIKDNVIYSDGTTILGGDDKAGIAALLEAVVKIKEENISHGDIQFIFTIAEEGGLFGSKNLDYSKLKGNKCFVLDSGGDIGTIVTKGPAQDKISVVIKGKPAHAGVCPEEGISAIEIASKAISNMKLLRVDENTTANIGKIVGGVATNVVCPEVTIEAEARSTVIESLDEQTQHMVKTFESVAESFGGSAEVDVERMYGEFVIEENEEIVDRAKKAIKALGIEPIVTSTGGGSDTNIFNGNGIAAVNLSSGERAAHTLEEHVYIDDLKLLRSLVIELIKA